MPAKEPFLIFTDGTCIIGSISYPAIPLLIGADNYILEAPSDWLRHLMVVRRKSTESVRQFGYHLKYWWSFLSRIRIAWDAVDDSVLMRWRDEYLQQGVDDATVNGYISTVFRMYLWAEKSGYTHGLIGEVDWERNFRPALSVEVKFNYRDVKIYTCPLLKRTTAKPILPTPSNDEITKVHESLSELYGDNVGLMIRDALILTWMEHTGIRRAEILALKLSQIPCWDQIVKIEEAGDKEEIKVVGKGNKRRSIWAGADLLSQTREYIEEERLVIITRFRSLIGKGYKKPDEVFLSSKTGFQLNRDTVSQKFAVAFRKAGVKGSGHRVRARFLTNLVENAFEREVEKLGSVPDLTSVLLPVAQIAGHSKVTTLQPYLAVAKKRLLRRTMAERAATAEERAISMERRLAAAHTKLKALKVLNDLVKALEYASKKSIVHELHCLLKVFS